MRSTIFSSRMHSTDWSWTNSTALALMPVLLVESPSASKLLAFVALFFGAMFFLYALKYYVSMALILIANGNGGGNGNGNGNGNGHENGNGHKNGNSHGLKGLSRNGGDKNKLPYHPYISIHLPMYNESAVVDRLLQSCTSLAYDNYEIVVADDSTDETSAILDQRWAGNSRVKISRRQSRAGFKGGALQRALQVTDPRAEFIAVFDADFIPPPDILQQFLSYFYGINANGNGHAESERPQLIDDRLAVVQGYQWHILNASENWITRGIRTEFAGSYVIERSSQELIGAMKMISGSVFMVRADVMRQHGWGTSITEDWELTLRLYLSGYKVLYTPFIQAPSECVATFKQLARQRMRWAEGHTFNVKKYFFQVLSSPNISLPEKLEFVYFAPYYLQSIFFILGTLCWLLSEVVFRYRLPMLPATLGWTLVFTNALSLVLMNLTGLFMERGVRRNWSGLLSFVLLTFMLVPYQAYAALKGLIEPNEGGWHRTQKTGVITDIVDKLGLGKRMRRLLPKQPKKRKDQGIDIGRRLGLPAAQIVARIPEPIRKRAGRISTGVRIAAALTVLLVLTTLLNSGGGLTDANPNWVTASVFLPIAATLVTERRRMATRVISVIVSLLVALALLSTQVVAVLAAPDPFYLRLASLNAGREMTRGQAGAAVSTLTMDAPGVYTWYSSEIYPTGGDDATVPAGPYNFIMDYSRNGPGGTITFTAEVGLANPDGTGYSQFGASTSQTTLDTPSDQDDVSISICASCSSQTITASSPKRIVIRLNVASVTATGIRLRLEGPALTNADSHLESPTVTVLDPSVLLMLVAVFIPILTAVITERRRLATRLAGIVVGMIMALGMISTQVEVVSAAPDAFYLHTTPLNGGESMNTATGSGAASLLFNTPGQSARWYTSLTYPLGGNDSTLDAGAYTMNLYFGALPGGGWWNGSYSLRKQLTVSTGAVGVSTGHEVALTLDHAALVAAGKSLSSGGDLRIVYFNGASWVELDRVRDPLTSWDTTGTKLWFALAGAILPNSSDNNYYLYYNNPAAGAPPANLAAIFNLAEDFEDGTLSVQLLVSTSGAATVSEAFGEAYIDGGSADSGAAILVPDNALPFNRRFAVRTITNLETGSSTCCAPASNTLLGVVESLFEPQVTDAATEAARRRVAVTQEAPSGDVYITYLDPSDTLRYWSGVAWTTTPTKWTTWTLNTYQVVELISAGSNWWVVARDMAGTVLTQTTSVAWTSVKNGGDDFWFYWGEPYTDRHWAIHRTDWFEIRDYVTPEPSLLASSEEGVPSVNLTVRVHHTRPDGTDPQLILSNSTTITPVTADPLAFSLGSALAQNFTSADPRKLRVEIQVNSVTNGGSFTLAYDSATDQSRLETPSITVLDPALILGAAGVFIPIITALATERRRMATRLISVILALLFALVLLSSQVATVTAAPDVFYLHGTDTGSGGWYNPDWLYRKLITVDAAQVAGSGSLAYFPVLINRTDPLWADTSNGGHVAQADGGDILFTASDGTTKLDHEIETYVNTSGQLIAWVEVASLSATVNTDLYIYYGNGTGVADQWNVAGTWNEGGANNFRGVWHEKEDPGPGGAGDIKDSTTNANHGTAHTSMLSTDQVSGQVNGSLHFDNVDDWVNAGSAASIDNLPAMTMEAWIKPEGWGEDATFGFGRILDKGTRKTYVVSSENGFVNTLKFLHTFSTRSSVWFAPSNSLSLNSWAHIVITYDNSSTSNVPAFYVNGQPVAATVDPSYAPGPSGTPTSDGAENLFIGNSDLGDRTFNGIIDEARYSNVIRSADWILTEYNNQSAPAAFYSVGSEQSTAISPAGEYMNTVAGTGAAALVFNNPGQSAHWYSDLTYPTGGNDGSIAAGNYTFNMYFDALPGAGGSFPAVAATNTSVNNVAGTNHIVSLPAGIQSGNLLIVTFGFKNGSGQTITWPGGWTEFFRQDQSTTIGVAAAYRQANGSEGSTITVQTSGSVKSSHNSYRITGAENPATQPPQSAGVGGNSTSPNPPNLTPTGGAKNYLWIAVETNNQTGSSIPISGFPTNYSSGIQANGDTTNSTTGSAYRQLNAAAEDPGNFTIGTAIAWAAGTLVVHPASTSTVDVRVTVSHTTGNGSGATTIVQSSTTTINSATANPLTLSVGSGAAQTFTSADPRRLRVDVDVIGVTGGGSFTLGYDSLADPSSLETPVLTVFDASVLFTALVVLIPVLTYILTEKKRRRMASRLISIVLSLLLALSFLAQDVIMAIAAPDAFYLHDASSGVTFEEVKSGGDGKDHISPDGDVAVTNWTDFGGNSLHYDELDDTNPDDDATYTQTSAASGGTGDDLTVSLTNFPDPLTNINHLVEYRWRNAGNSTGDAAIAFTAELLQGNTVIASQAQSAATVTAQLAYTTNTFTLSAAQADSITDYNDLRIRFNITTKSAGSSGSRILRVTLAEFTVNWPLSVSTSANLTARTSHLYLASISTKNASSVVQSVSGLGLTWTFVDRQCGGRNQTMVEVWRALGTPTGDGVVTANFDVAEHNAVISVSRYSGVNTASPIGAVTSANSNGVNGACSGGTDALSGSVNLTTTAANSYAYGGFALRSRNMTAGSGFLERDEAHFGPASGEIAGVATEDRLVASASTVAVDGSFSSTLDWAIVAVEIKSRGTSPAGKVFDGFEGIGGATLTFDTPGQSAYWYSDLSYPTGTSDASIAAGSYTLNMYFNSLPAASFPQVAATNTSVNNVAGTNHTVNLPSGIQSGQLLIVVFGFKNGSSQTLTWPGGWTEFFRQDQSTTTGVAAAYRQADGTEGSTITVQTGSSVKTSHNSYRITGAENPATQPPQSAGVGGNSTGPNPPLLTPTGGAKNYLWIAVETNNQTGTSIPITGFPTSYSTGIQANGDTTNSTTGSAYRQLNAASEDPGAFTIGTAIAWASGTLVVHPAATPAVDVRVTVSHTALDGSGATTIVQSSTTTINSGTTDPLAISVGAGALQTFTAASPRLLRVMVEVMGVSGSGFVLDYDGTCATNRCSSLDTPSVTVPDVSLLMATVVVFIPLVTFVVTEQRRRRMAMRLISVAFSVLAALGLLSRDVMTAVAAPDTFYLHNTATSGIAPAGKYKNVTSGSGASTLVFNTPGQNAYWYTDISYPTGADDASIAAGAYTLNMYFSQLPQGGSWWDASYGKRQQLTLTAPASGIASGYPVRLELNHSALVSAGDSQADGDDLRVVYWNGSTWTEIARTLFNNNLTASSWNLASTAILFKTQAAIAGSGSDNGYYLYYKNAGATSPPTNTLSSRYFVAESLSATNGTASYVSKVSLTFTPTSTSEQWVVVGSWRQQHSGAASNQFLGESQITVNSLLRTGTDRVGYMQEGNNWKTFSSLLLITGVSSPQTVSIDFMNSGGTDQIDNARLIAFMIPDAANANVQYGESLTIAADTVNPTSALTTTFTPSSAGNYIWMTSGSNHEGPGGAGTGGLSAVDEAGTEQQETDDTWLAQAASFVPFIHFEQRNLTTGSKSFVIRHRPHVGAPGSERQGLTQLLFRSDVFDAVETADSVPYTLTSSPTYVDTSPPLTVTTASAGSNRDYVYLVVMGMLESAQNAALSTAGEVRLDSVQQTEEVSAIARDGYEREVSWAYAESSTGGRTINARFRGSTGLEARAHYGHILSLRYKNPTTALGAEETPGGNVNITVYVHHTKIDGTDPVLITSASTTITNSTTDPLFLSLGSAAQQTFTSADPRLLRVQVAVNSVANAGSFTLGYDSVADPSSLDTPSLTVPELSLLFTAVALLIPVLTAMMTMRRKRAVKLISVMVSFLAALGILAGQVEPVTAAPDTFYLHDSAAGGTGWYNSSWLYRKKITIQDSQVSGSSNHSNFPVLINTTDPTWRDTASGGKVGQADGGDILFTTSDGVTKLDHEIEQYVNTSGQLIAWVEVPTLNATANTQVYIYYGNAGAADQWNITGTWDEGGANNFKGVWHLDEDAAGTGTVDLYQDSTSNNNHGDDFVSATGKTGKVNGGQGFDGTDDYVDVPYSASLDNTGSQITIEAWVQFASTFDNTAPENQTLIDGGGKIEYWFESSTGKLNFSLNTCTPTCSWSAALQSTQISWTGGPTWYHVVSVYNGTNRYIYVNSALDNSGGLTGTLSPTGSGTRISDPSGVPSNEGPFNGNIDEVRISNIARSADWIATEFNNQNAPSTFYTIGALESFSVSPSGKTFNTTPGAAGSTLTFDTGGQNAYWYSDVTWPTGGDNGGIAAGAYALNMHFSELPRPWWNASYGYRQRITVTAGSAAVASGYSIPLTIDHAALSTAGKSISNGDDLRVVYWNGSSWVELDRLLDDLSFWNNASTKIWFRTQAAIGASGSDANYYLYYGNPLASSPPANWANIFRFYDNFNDGSFDTARWTCTAGTCTESGGTLTVNPSSRAFATATYAIGTNTIWDGRVQLGGDGQESDFNLWGASDADGFSNDWITFWTSAATSNRENANANTWTTTAYTPITPTSFHNYTFARIGASSVAYYLDGSELTPAHTTNIPNANLRAMVWNTNGSFSMVYDWVRVRDYVSPEPSSSATGETTSANVNIVVTVSHAAPDGTGSTNIVQTGTISINSSTPNPYTLSLGSGSAQTFTSSDPRRLRVQVNVTSLDSGERFVLRYDGTCISSQCSNLDTPVVTVPDWGLAFLILVPLIPFLMAAIWRRKRLAGTLASTSLGAIIAISILAGQVMPTTAAPDVFYLHNTATTTGIAHQESLTTAQTTADPYSLPSVAGGTDQLYLVSVAIYGTGISVSSVSGGGLTWTLQKAQCSARIAQPRVEIWRAFGSPSAFAASVDLSGAPLRSSAAISRYSGVNPTTPTEAAAGSNSNGLNGACTGGTDNANASLSLTSSTINSVLFVAIQPRGTTITTADVDYAQRAFISNVSGGDGANLYIHDRTLTNPGSDSADHTLNAAVDWDMAGVVINPASSVNPAGRYKNITEGSAGSTVPFNTAGQNAYWYADQTWPTGAGDATIAAGTYTSNLYFNSRPAPFGVQVDSASSASTQRTSMTISHTTSGSNRLMLVGVTINNNQSETVSSVTYNGLALTLVGTAASTTNTRVEIWRRIAPSTGTHDVVITFSGNLRYGAKAGVMTFTGVHQTTPLGTFAGANGNTVGPATVNVTSAATDLVFDTVGCEGDNSTLCTSLTVGASQTQRWNLFALDAGTTAAALRGAGSTEPGIAGTVTMSWTIAPATAVPWAIGAVPIKPSGASAPVVDTVSSGDARPASLTISHTTSGLNRLMLVGISMINDELETVSSVTYNGLALTSVGNAVSVDDARVDIFRLIAPPTGTYNVVITFSAPLRRAAIAGVMTFTGVDQTTPLGTFASAFDQSPLLTEPPSVAVTSGTNELVFDTVACETCTSFTVDPSQAQRWNISEPSGYPATYGAGSTEPGAPGTVTMSWTQGTADFWAIGGVSIKPAATPAVNVTVSVHHTAPDGSGATLITSASTSITSSTADPLALNLGSPLAQTFTSADPRRLRVRVEVTGVTSGASFVLDYDGTCATSKCSSLDTPVVTVPEYGLAFALVVLFIPMVMGGAWRRERLVRRSRQARDPFAHSQIRRDRRDRQGSVPWERHPQSRSRPKT